MKAFTFILAGFVLTTSVQAYESPRFYEEARAVKLDVALQVEGIPGVMAVGIVGCDARSGDLHSRRSDTYCVIISAKTELARQRALELFPAGQKYRGFFVWAIKIELVRKPRMSGGK